MTVFGDMWRYLSDGANWAGNEGILALLGQQLLLTKGAPGTSTRTAIGYIATEGLSSFRMGAASAMSYVLAIFLLLISLISFRVFRERQDQS